MEHINVCGWVFWGMLLLCRWFIWSNIKCFWIIWSVRSPPQEILIDLLDLVSGYWGPQVIHIIGGGPKPIGIFPLQTGIDTLDFTLKLLHTHGQVLVLTRNRRALLLGRLLVIEWWVKVHVGHLHGRCMRTVTRWGLVGGSKAGGVGARGIHEFVLLVHCY